jgi:CBS domain-containing protein
MNFPDPVSMLLRQKGKQAFSIPSDASVYSALELMADKNVGDLLVVDDNRLVGIISERDYTRKVVLLGRSSRDTFVRDIMRSSPVTIRSDTSVDEAMRVMRDHGIRHVPVIDSEEHVTGVLSMRDLMNWIISSQEKAIGRQGKEIQFAARILHSPSFAGEDDMEN